MGEDEQLDAVDAEFVEARGKRCRFRAGVDERDRTAAADHRGVALPDVAQRELPVGRPAEVGDDAGARQGGEVRHERDHDE